VTVKNRTTGRYYLYEAGDTKTRNGLQRLVLLTGVDPAILQLMVPGWVIFCGQVNHLAYNQHQGQLSLPSFRGRKIEYRPIWLGLGRADIGNSVLSHTAGNAQ